MNKAGNLHILTIFTVEMDTSRDRKTEHKDDTCCAYMIPLFSLFKYRHCPVFSKGAVNLMQLGADAPHHFVQD